MRIAVLSDIHSNYVALEACFNYIEQQCIDGIIYLGDYVSDCPYPQKTLSLILEKSKRYQSWFVMGNREEYLLNHHEDKNSGWKYSSSSGSLLYTYENLNHSDIEFFRKCKNTIKIEFTGCLPLFACHGSPMSSREQLFSGTERIDDYLRNLEESCLLCGHSHMQFLYSNYGKTVINPGSVGVQTNGQTKSQFAILNWNKDQWLTEFISVEYNIGKLLSEFEVSGLNHKAKMWSKAIQKSLQTGINYPLMCLELAYKLASEAETLCEPFYIEEEFWNEAGRRIGIK
ncbi:MAG: metallophosphoesterase [Eubacterium sp.]|nr:metallophosphoesterase [Eubacterium sp.]